VLVVCGFAFDPHVSEEAKRYGKLTVLPTRMNPDLAMGDELLKKTGAGNLFTVFGEPDVEIARDTDGNLSVQINGLDVYDPTTGQIRNSSTDEGTWSTLFSTVSRPFAPPDHGKIAVKVINHYGDEVLKVFEV